MALAVGAAAAMLLPKQPRRMLGARGEARRLAVCLHAKTRKQRQQVIERPKPKQAEPELTEEEQMIILPAEGITLTDLAERIKQPAANIIMYFFKDRGIPLTLNDILERDLVEEVAEHYGVEVLFDDDLAESTAGNRGFLAETENQDKPRPPVVTVMGHVDHGKTTLLDTIRKRSVAATEAGGITQKIGAYQVKVGSGSEDEEKVTFIDTPGHEAFTQMRARGAQVTDIAILVVAADDGVMPQTQEAIAHARAAGVPIIVAINKIDMPGAQPDNVRNELASEGLTWEEWGGDIPMVEISAKKNINLDGLLEMVSLTAQIAELKADYDSLAGGVILESYYEEKRGVLATMLVQKGTLRVGDVAVAGTSLCRVRSMQNEGGKNFREAPPSMAVQVLGFGSSPGAGDQFEVFPNVQKARAEIDRREREAKHKSRSVLQGFSGITGKTSDSGQVIPLSLILKADSQGSIAAVKYMFDGVKNSKYINLRWILATPGPITESDVELARTCPKDQRAMILGFNTSVKPHATHMAKNSGVEIRAFNIIYELHETVVAALENSLSSEEKLIEQGVAEVLAVFDGKFGKVAGCRVTKGMLKVGNRVKVFRKNTLVGTAPILSLRQGPQDVQDVDQDNECGFTLDGWDSWKAGDSVRCYEVKLVKPTLIAQK